MIHSDPRVLSWPEVIWLVHVYVHSGGVMQKHDNLSQVVTLRSMFCATSINTTVLSTTAFSSRFCFVRQSDC